MSKNGISSVYVEVLPEEHHPKENPTGHHHHRAWADIRKTIEDSSLSDGVKRKSTAVFENLTVAERNIHTPPTDEAAFEKQKIWG